MIVYYFTEGCQLYTIHFEMAKKTLRQKRKKDARIVKVESQANQVVRTKTNAKITERGRQEAPVTAAVTNKKATSTIQSYTPLVSSDEVATIRRDLIRTSVIIGVLLILQWFAMHNAPALLKSVAGLKLF